MSLDVISQTIHHKIYCSLIVIIAKVHIKVGSQHGHAAVRREERAQDQIMNTSQITTSFSSLTKAVASGVSDALGPVAGHTKAACTLPCRIPANH